MNLRLVHYDLHVSHVVINLSNISELISLCWNIF